jgi:hypothetical protein
MNAVLHRRNNTTGGRRLARTRSSTQAQWQERSSSSEAVWFQAAWVCVGRPVRVRVPVVSARVEGGQRCDALERHEDQTQGAGASQRYLVRREVRLRATRGSRRGRPSCRRYVASRWFRAEASSAAAGPRRTGQKRSNVREADQLAVSSVMLTQWQQQPSVYLTPLRVRSDACWSGARCRYRRVGCNLRPC